MRTVEKVVLTRTQRLDFVEFAPGTLVEHAPHMSSWILDIIEFNLVFTWIYCQISVNLCHNSFVFIFKALST